MRNSSKTFGLVAASIAAWGWLHQRHPLPAPYQIGVCRNLVRGHSERSEESGPRHCEQSPVRRTTRQSRFEFSSFGHSNLFRVSDFEFRYLIRTFAFLLLLFLITAPARAQYGGGSGTAANPYLIYTAEQMNAIGANSNDWDKHFKLIADIDLSGYIGAEFNIIGTGYFECPPIGFCYLVSTPFTGTFDGNDHEILNFTYSYTGLYIIGLFGIVDGENAEIKNLRLIDPNVAVEAHAGSLVGYLVNGTITDCYVEGGSISGDRAVGGLIGSSSNTASISNCHATGHVSGNYNIGGLVGSSYGTISECSSEVSVVGNGWVGGLCGFNSGGISSCYSSGNISGTSYVGGLVGENRAPISNCYSMASVSGDTSSVGGLVGRNGRTVWNCYSTGRVLEGGGLIGRGGGAFGSYWDIETSGQMTSAGGTGKTTAQMQMASTFIGWGGCEDPGWTIDEGNDYPRLLWENMPGEPLPTQRLSDFIAGCGTEDDPYMIYTSEQLNMIGLFPCEWNKHFNLMADIDLAGFSGTVFNIIGTASNPFTGVFDGRGHRISNFIYASLERSVGLFGYVDEENAEIKDLTLTDPNINVAGDSVYVGILVGRLKNGTISNCGVEGGSVLGRNLVGGLVGDNHGTISNCYATASVSSNDDYVGGLVGWNRGWVLDCCFSGNVVGRIHVGGLVGANDGTITNCYSFGSVSSQSYVGGLAGSNSGEMSCCYSVATVTAAPSYAIAGGLVGDNEQWGVIFNCYSIGRVSGGWKVGGLVGLNDNEISNCYSAGRVEGSPVGGLVGDNRSGTITNTFWDMESSGQMLSDGGIGKVTAEMQMASTFINAGWDFVGEIINGTEDIWTICKGVDYPKLTWQFIIGDFDGDDDVDFTDFAVLAARWLQTDSSFWCGGTDLTNDGNVDFYDLKAFAGNWLAGR